MSLIHAQIVNIMQINRLTNATVKIADIIKK